MRILGFQQYWGKLNKAQFTTFRFTRKDKDWHKGEIVKIVLNPRSKAKQELGTAYIITKEERHISPFAGNNIPSLLTTGEAIDDGFISRKAMMEWIHQTYGSRYLWEPMNKLTLVWLECNEQRQVETIK